MASLRAAAASQAATSSSTRCQAPVRARVGAAGRRSLVARVAESNSSVPATSSSPPVLDWPSDNETARDVFAFAGSLPERLNGRVAMLGFTGIALAELKSQVPAAEQFGSDVAGVLLLSVTLTLASIFPKFVSGCSLKELHASATSDNLKAKEGLGQVLGLFDQATELWAGRLAMIGIAGLLATEAVTGKVLF